MKLQELRFKRKRPKPFLILLIVLAIYGVVFLLDRFFDTFNLSFQSPVILQTPIKIEKRKNELISPLVEEVEAKEASDLEASPPFYPIPLPSRPEDLIEAEIWDVFGANLYEEALAVFKCESGLNPGAVGKNTNGTYDVGIPQINTVHGIKSKWLKNPGIAIRVAKQLYDETGDWSAWYSSYKCHKIK